MSAGRDYITPEDIAAVIRSGCNTKQELLEIVLEAIANRTCEDPSGCAFAALNFIE